MEPICIISAMTPAEIMDSLISHGFSLIPVPQLKALAPPVAHHADMQLFIHEERCIHYAGIDAALRSLLTEHVECHEAATEPRPEYPDDIALNVAVAGRHAFHRSDRTDPVVRDYLNEAGITLHHVTQGYSNCSTLVVDERHIITADHGIADAAEGAGISVLRIMPGHIELPGYNYGFIGGCGGVWNNTVYLTGSLSLHPHGGAIHDFITATGKKVAELRHGPLRDVGGLILIQQP